MRDAPQNPHTPGASDDNQPQKPLLIIHNSHVPDSGKPPHYEDTLETSEYIGYFRNQHGEQWVLAYDFDIETGIVCGGDAGWERLHTFVDGRTPGLVINDEERAWLLACWLAVNVGRQYRDEKRNETGTTLKYRPRTVWKTTTIEQEPIELAHQAGRRYLDGDLLVAFVRQSDKAAARIQTEDREVTITHTDFDRLMAA